MIDVGTRLQTMNMMITNPSIMLPVMGLARVDYGDGIKEKCQTACESLKDIGKP
jgi:hypothetical protein